MLALFDEESGEQVQNTFSMMAIEVAAPFEFSCRR